VGLALMNQCFDELSDVLRFVLSSNFFDLRSNLVLSWAISMRSCKLSTGHRLLAISELIYRHNTDCHATPLS
jgi:hypothetical protein